MGSVCKRIARNVSHSVIGHRSPRGFNRVRHANPSQRLAEEDRRKKEREAMLKGGQSR